MACVARHFRRRSLCFLRRFALPINGGKWLHLNCRMYQAKSARIPHTLTRGSRIVGNARGQLSGTASQGTLVTLDA